MLDATKVEQTNGSPSFLNWLTPNTSEMFILFLNQTLLLFSLYAHAHFTLFFNMSFNHEERRGSIKIMAHAAEAFSISQSPFY